jgi:murein tripeptide amidase MpaA
LGECRIDNNRPRIAASNGDGAQAPFVYRTARHPHVRGDQTDDRALFLYEAQFGRLRDLAHRAGMRVNVPGTSWLGRDELSLLAWLAQAQRVLSYTKSFHRDAMLTLTVVHCAGTLNALGIQLPPLTLQHASTVEETE